TGRCPASATSRSASTPTRSDPTCNAPSRPLEQHGPDRAPLVPAPRMLIGDERPAVAGDRLIRATSPIDGRHLTDVADASAQQVRDAITAAESAFVGWRRTSGLERARLMHRLADVIERDADDLALLETTDNGKLLRE